MMTLAGARLKPLGCSVCRLATMAWPFTLSKAIIRRFGHVDIVKLNFRFGRTAASRGRRRSRQITASTAPMARLGALTRILTVNLRRRTMAFDKAMQRIPRMFCLPTDSTVTELDLPWSGRVFLVAIPQLCFRTRVSRRARCHH